MSGNSLHNDVDIDFLHDISSPAWLPLIPFIKISIKSSSLLPRSVEV